MDRRLLLARWRVILTDNGLFVLMALCLIPVWNDGVTWRNAAESLLVAPAVVALALLAAVAQCAGLARRARGSGLPVTVHADDDTQTLTLPGTWSSEDQDRFRAALLASGRSAGVEESPVGELRFQWRPLRSWRFVRATVSRDGTTGGVRLDIRGGEEQKGRDREQPGRHGFRLPPGSSFVALCQLVRLAGTSAPR
ncbi:hypothetical protein [Streptomyces sp. ID05-47C]|uniref:hypothetical protein n=1 Tax=Streptomyces sp. ID05-47C TaxID=3028665 RepID=UPI0029BB07E0|nr:hypothetical protein [Streptomyces sp. ID05-47C]MDX3574460.1 hypothetical protein [Streptomyces sp. ID05-47C]